MSLKHVMYMAEMKKRYDAKETAKQGAKAPDTKGQTAVKMRRHRLPR